jgi:hypothetical protein
MIDRRSLGLLVAIPVLIIIILAGSSFFSSSPRNPILIKGATTATSANPAVSPTPSAVFGSISSGPSFTLAQNANCYNGPSADYDVVFNVQAGTILDVIGRNLDNTWWRVSDGPAIDCWVPSDVGTFSGESASIPITSSRYATQALTPPTPTRERRTAEPTSAGGAAPATAVPTNVPAQPTNTSAPVANTLPPVINTLPPILDTPVPSTGAPTDAPPPPPEQTQAPPPGLIHRPATHTPQAPVEPTAITP